MCGLAGYLAARADGTAQDMQARLRPMAQAIRHRGPDSDGFWVDPAAAIGLAHRRLAIVDLSEAGHQPMPSVSGRYVIAYNGEIYNHLRLRDELQRAGRAPTWRGHSDTETLLAGFDAWGIEATLQRCIGMFAIALWDREQRSLTLARDRLGEKPLYYGWQGRGQNRAFLFGSELKALRQHPAFEGDIDRNALTQLLRHNYIGAPHCIYQQLHKLEPGCLLQVSLERPEPVITPYWSALQVALHGQANRFAGTADEAVDQLEVLMKDAIGQQMMADVPLGAFLSGGVDSSAVVALMQAQSSRPVKTFTIGFEDAAYDESGHARAVAAHLGTEHTELRVTPQQALDVIPRLPALYDEPFSDSSQIPTFLVAEMARKHVTVSLSGDAGDELFCGYQRYLLTQRVWKKLSAIPRPARALAASALTMVSPAGWNRCRGALQAIVPATRSWSNPGDKLHKGARLLNAGSIAELYRGLISHWPDPAAVVLGGQELATTLLDSAQTVAPLGDLQAQMALDLITYLPGDILTKVDRAAMGVSLETRVPLLDHRLVEFAWSLPIDYKLRDGQGKWPLRQVLYRHVPKALIERPKMGFGVPIKDWLRGPLRDWADGLLDENRLRQQGFFDASQVRNKWTEHLSGARDWQAWLWDVLMFQAWLDHQVEK